jgi:hypothetical protein
LVSVLRLLKRARPYLLVAGVTIALLSLVELGMRRGVLDPRTVDKGMLGFVCFCLGVLAAVGLLLWLLRSSRFPEEAPEPAERRPRGPDVNRLYYMREFLPETPPSGWSIPVAPNRASTWHIETGQERVIAELEQEAGLCALRVTVARHDRAEISDDRATEILGHFRGVGEFVEGVEMPDRPTARTWIAVPRGMRPKWRVPEAPPEPREPELSPHLVAARKYLPERVPKGWSVPVAITDDHGMDWKDGAWMMGAGQEVIIACLCTSKGRVKLAVTIFRRDGEEVTEGTALELLRQFRGVLEFVQTDPSEDEEEGPPRCTYLGELQPARAERAMLN